MPRKIQRKPKHSLDLEQRAARIQPVPRGVSIQEAITILGGTTGVIVAILWVAGRFYTAGYFAAMNIPAFQVSFSIWEYAEASWLKLVFFLLRRTYGLFVVAAAISLLVPALAFLVQALFPRLKVFDGVRYVVSRGKDVPSAVNYALAFSILVYLSYILLRVFIDINQSGQIEGKNIVFTSSYGVEVFSRDFLPLGTPTTLQGTTPVLMRYEGLRLLTFNNGKYYLFREIDPVTCKPAQVFVISDSPDIHFVFRAITPLEATCSSTSTATPTP